MRASRHACAAVVSAALIGVLAGALPALPASAGMAEPSCDSVAQGVCAAGGRHCFESEQAKCFVKRGRDAEVAREDGVALGFFQEAAVHWLAAAREASAASAWVLLGEALVGYVDAIVEIVGIHERAEQHFEAGEILDAAVVRLDDAIAASRATVDEQVRAKRKELEVLVLGNPRAQAEELVRQAGAAKTEAAALKDDDAKEARYSRAAALYEDAASAFRRAHQGEQDAERCLHLLRREVDSWLAAHELRDRGESPLECDNLQSALASVADVGLRVPAVASTLEIETLRLDLDLVQCKAFVRSELAQSCPDELCAAEQYLDAARGWNRALRSAVAPNSRFPAAFPDATERYDRLVEMTKSAVWAYEKVSEELRDRVGRATSQGRFVEAEAIALVEELVNLTHKEPILQQQLRDIKVRRVAKARGKLLYPAGDFVVAGSVSAGLGVAALAVSGWSFAEINRGLETEGESCAGGKICWEDGKKYARAGIGLAVTGGVLVSVGAALVATGVMRYRKAPRERLRGSIEVRPTGALLTVGRRF